MSKFKRFWDKAERTVINQIEKAIAEAATRTFTEIVDKTPLGRPELWENPKAPADYTPGTLIQNWEINYGSGYNKTRQKRNFSAKLNSISSSAQYTLGNTIWVRNQTPYAYAVEYGRSRKQAPQGMMRISIKKYNKFLDQATKRNKF